MLWRAICKTEFKLLTVHFNVTSDVMLSKTRANFGLHWSNIIIEIVCHTYLLQLYDIYAVFHKPISSRAAEVENPCTTYHVHRVFKFCGQICSRALFLTLFLSLFLSCNCSQCLSVPLSLFSLILLNTFHLIHRRNVSISFLSTDYNEHVHSLEKRAHANKIAFYIMPKKSPQGNSIKLLKPQVILNWMRNQIDHTSTPCSIAQAPLPINPVLQRKKQNKFTR